MEQYLRSLSGVFLNVATLRSPDVIFTAVGFHRLKALTGPPDHERQDWQWQYPIASGSPVTSRVTEPQKQLPVCIVRPFLLQCSKAERMRADPAPHRRVFPNLRVHSPYFSGPYFITSRCSARAMRAASPREAAPSLDSTD